MIAKRGNEFSSKTKKSIMKQSSARCAIKGCHSYCDNGRVCHIYPASENGPQRSYEKLNKLLNDNDRKSPSNAIYTCINCSYVIDNNAYVKDYPASDLIIFKAIAEYISKILNKCEDVRFIEKNYGYLKIYEIVFSVVGEDLQDVYFGLKIDSSIDQKVIKALKDRLMVVFDGVQQGKIDENLIKCKSSIKEWTEYFLDCGYSNEFTYCCSYAYWFIKISGDGSNFNDFLFGDIGQILFINFNKINHKERPLYPIIKCNIFEMKRYSFSLEIQAFNNGLLSSNIKILSLNNITISTIDFEWIYQFGAYLDFIETICKNNTNSIKIYISANLQKPGHKNTNFLEVDSDFEISEKNIVAYRKAKNLVDGIRRILNKNNFHLTINLGVYLKSINEDVFLPALEELVNSKTPRNIFLGDCGNFKYFLNLDKYYNLRIMHEFKKLPQN